MKAWHFVGDTLRDGTPIPADGEWFEHEGKIEICRSGLHYSECVFDALQYAPGNTLCRVVVDGIEDTHDDKGVARRRMILWRIDAESILREAARLCALEVVDLWDAPKVVRDFLQTGDESLAAAARAAAEAAAWGAAWDAAATRAAARAEAWAAARAEAATRAAARAAAAAEARGAAWDAAATRAAARAAAGDAAAAKQRQILRDLIARELRKQRAAK